MNQWIFNAVLRIPALLLGIGLHEWAHAYAADRHGDSLPASQGRLSLNPLDHLDPIGTLCIIFAPIGWGKPVMINPSAYKDPLRDQMRVALAGPMMNLAIASIASAVYWLAVYNLPPTEWSQNIVTVLVNIIAINLGLAFFNMIPVPPLDGSKVLRAMGSVETAEIIGRIESAGTGMLIILFLVTTGFIQPLFIPVKILIKFLFSDFYYSIGFGVLVFLVWAAFVSSFPRCFTRR